DLRLKYDCKTTNTKKILKAVETATDFLLMSKSQRLPSRFSVRKNRPMPNAQCPVWPSSQCPMPNAQ
ncbi:MULTISPECIES: hypothetical protein, partial [unclassified Microcoleus]